MKNYSFSDFLRERNSIINPDYTKILDQIFTQNYYFRMFDQLDFKLKGL